MLFPTVRLISECWARLEALSAAHQELEDSLDRAKLAASYEPTTKQLTALRKLQHRLEESSAQKREAERSLHQAEADAQQDSSPTELAVARTIRRARAKHSEWVRTAAELQLSRLPEKLFSRTAPQQTDRIPLDGWDGHLEGSVSWTAAANWTAVYPGEPSSAPEPPERLLASLRVREVNYSRELIGEVREGGYGLVRGLLSSYEAAQVNDE